MQYGGCSMKEILRLFPEMFRRSIQKNIAKRWSSLQEIRFLLQQPIQLVFDQHVEWMKHLKPNQQDTQFILNQLNNFFLYLMYYELLKGYITIKFAHLVE